MEYLGVALSAIEFSSDTMRLAYDQASGFSRNLGVEYTHGDVTYSNGGTSKIVKYPTARKRIETGDLSQLVSFGLYHVVNDEFPALNSSFSFCCNAACATVAVVWNSKRFDSGALELLNVAKQLSEIGEFNYGYGFSRSRDKGPVGYPWGVVTGLGYSPEEVEEADRIGKWLLELPKRRKMSAGSIRDVYPLNLLGQESLRRNVGEISLADWIADAPYNSTIDVVNEHLTAWMVPSEDVTRVREKLVDEAPGLICTA